jgi:hypothetical protein
LKLFPYRYATRLNHSENDPIRVAKALLQWAEAITYPDSPIFPVIVSHLLTTNDYSSCPYIIRRILARELFKVNSREDLVAALVAGGWAAYKRWDPKKGKAQSFVTWLSWTIPFETCKFLYWRAIKEDDTLLQEENTVESRDDIIDLTLNEFLLRRNR